MHKNSTGFTLIEIMVVIIVIAIAAGIMVPNLQGSTETIRLRAAARRLSDLMEFCYHSAITTGRVHGLIFDENKRRFEVIAEEKNKASDQPQVFDDQPALNIVPLPIAVDRTMPEGVKIKSVDIFREKKEGEEESEQQNNSKPELRIFFFPDGTSEFATVALAALHGEKREVVLNGLSGTVTTYIPKPDDEDNQEERESR